jgi:CRP/FNR family transcriptional regulator, anaerobic regulatory protein
MQALVTPAPKAKLAKLRGSFPVSTRAFGPQAEALACPAHREEEPCPSSGHSERILLEFASVILSRRRMKFGDALYRAGEVFESVYLVRAGFVKTVVLLEDGREQVTRLCMPGEMLGMDGLASGHHASDATALCDGEVCVVPYHRLENLEHEGREVQRQLNRMFSHEIVRGQRMMLLLGSMRAEERVAAFLLNLSERFTALGYSPSEFILRMTRDEIGSLLGIKLETVSRIFSKLQRNALIEIEGKHVHIISSEGLRGIVSG